MAKFNVTTGQKKHVYMITSIFRHKLKQKNINCRVMFEMLFFHGEYSTMHEHNLHFSM